MNMNTNMKILLVSSVTVLALGLGGCGKNGLHGSSGSPIVNGHRNGNGTEVNGVSGASGFNGESFGGDTMAASASLPKTIYFGFDKYNLTDKAADVASQNAALLLKDPSMHVMIEGHTDPRGSESYNFHLGERRANAVQSYFLQHGVAATQVCTVSYGELRPAANPSQFGGDKLKAYALDRRAVIQYNKTCEGAGDAVAEDAPVAAPKPVHHVKKKPKPVVTASSVPKPVTPSGMPAAPSIPTAAVTG